MKSDLIDPIPQFLSSSQDHDVPCAEQPNPQSPHAVVVHPWRRMYPLERKEEWHQPTDDGLSESIIGIIKVVLDTSYIPCDYILRAICAVQHPGLNSKIYPISVVLLPKIPVSHSVSRHTSAVSLLMKLFTIKGMRFLLVRP